MHIMRIAIALYLGLGLTALPAMATTPIACTDDAKLCADGSSVGRSGPNCQFAACPEEKPAHAPAPSAIYPVYEVAPVIYWDTDRIIDTAQQRAISLKQQIQQLASETNTPIWFHHYVNPLGGSWIQL